MRKITHQSKCYACNKRKHPTMIGYHLETMKSYCLDREECPASEEIPDAEFIPVTDEDVNTAIAEHYPEEAAELFGRLLGKVASVRLQPAHIMHLFKISSENRISTIGQTIIDIFEADMQARNMDHIALDMEEKPKPEYKRNSDVHFHDLETSEPLPIVDYGKPYPEPEPEPVKQAEPEEEQEEKDDDEWEI